MTSTGKIISQECAERAITNHYRTSGAFPQGHFRICGLDFTKVDSLDMTGHTECWQVFKRDPLKPYDARQQFVDYRLTKERTPQYFA